MRSLLSILFLLLASSAHAAPGATGDEMNRLLSNNGLLEQIEQVRHSVTETASEVRRTVADTASALVFNALGFLGVPYKRGGNTAETGFDCSGFVRAIYEQTLGLVLPRKAEQQAAATEKIEKAELQPGDLVFFNTMKRTFSHVGIYVGNSRFIHSPKPGSEVRVEDMNQRYWKLRFDGARRVTSNEAAAATLQARALRLQAMQSAEPGLR